MAKDCGLCLGPPSRSDLSKANLCSILFSQVGRGRGASHIRVSFGSSHVVHESLYGKGSSSTNAGSLKLQSWTCQTNWTCSKYIFLPQPFFFELVCAVRLRKCRSHANGQVTCAGEIPKWNLRVVCARKMTFTNEMFKQESCKTLCASGAVLEQMILFLTCRDLRKASRIVLQGKGVSPCGFGVKTLQRSLNILLDVAMDSFFVWCFLSLMLCKEFFTWQI